MGKDFLQALYCTQIFFFYFTQSLAKTTMNVSTAVVPVGIWLFQHTADEQPAVAVVAAELV